MLYRFQTDQKALDFYIKYFPKYEVELDGRYVTIYDHNLMNSASRMGGTLEQKRANQ